MNLHYILLTVSKEHFVTKPSWNVVLAAAQKLKIILNIMFAF